MASIIAHMNAHSNHVNPVENQRILEALRNDLEVICKKLDSDGGVTDNNYAAQLKVKK